MNLLRPELYELYALEFAIFDSVYTLATANKDQSAPNLVKIYMTIRCQINLIMIPIGLELQEYLPLNKERLLNLTLFTL